MPRSRPSEARLTVSSSGDRGYSGPAGISGHRHPFVAASVGRGPHDGSAHTGDERREDVAKIPTKRRILRLATRTGLVHGRAGGRHHAPRSDPGEASLAQVAVVGSYANDAFLARVPLDRPSGTPLLTADRWL